ncbi:MAG TPA: alkaline phosphatase family protein [Candidatus Baltobacteraceae bacterium]|jgi:phospholipase C
MNRRLLSATAFAVALSLAAGCGGVRSASPLPYAPTSTFDSNAASPNGAGQYIKHVIVVIQENRSFDSLFATFPNAAGTTIGKTPHGTIKLHSVPLASPKFTPHNAYSDFKREWDGGNMDGFWNEAIAEGKPGSYLYQYVAPKDVVPYWTLAKQYVLADHMFQTQGSSSFTGHQDLIRGDTAVGKTQSAIDNPSNTPWGCNAATGTTTGLLTLSGKYSSAGTAGNPYPCFGSTYETLRDTLDAKHIGWKYYEPQYGGAFFSAIWSAFAAVKVVYSGPEWNANVSSPETNIFTDIKNGRLPSMSWIVPDANNSDHPGTSGDTGPSWVASIVNAVGKSQYWKSTAIVVVWDDWGGFYDHVLPPVPGKVTVSNLGGPGFRVPMIVVSAYAKKGYISHKQYEFGSVVKFVETVFGLPSLHTTDATTAGFVTDFFDFASPRGFTPVPAKYSQSFFEHQAPSNQPVDTE